MLLVKADVLLEKKFNAVKLRVKCKFGSICRLRMVSKTLTDRQISDAEFQSIMTEYSQYHALREAVRAKFTRQTFRPDIEKIKKDLRGEVGEEFRKKNYSRL